MGNIIVKTNSKLLLLATASLFAFGSAAQAQDAPADTAEAPVETAETTTDTQAEMEFLKAQIDALQAQVEQLAGRVTKAEPSWKGAPQWQDKEAGWAFKVRGRLMYDMGYVSNPGITPAQSTGQLGFNSRVRRARLGVEGSLPGGFSYKGEADFASNAVSWADVFLEYKPGTSPFSVRVGHFESFQSLEQITSSRHITFMERAQMNDAFGHARRLGIAIGYDKGDWLYRAGWFNDTINSDLNNDEWLFGTRLVYAPKMGANQLHFGLNYQHRVYSESGLAFRYRARPFLQTTGLRFADTNSFAAKGDDVFGVEAAGVFGSLHVAAEGQYVKPEAYASTKVFTGNETPGTTNRLADDPSFYSFYVEAGYWLTGETRGYKKGEWDRTKVLNGFDKGGFGAVGINLRYDYLDLNDATLRVGGVGTSAARGGTQTGYLASIIWQPIDYVRITAQYAHSEVEGGPFASTIKPTSTAPVYKRGYGIDTFGMRFAYDF